MNKSIVLDTNVILHDANCIFNFQDNDVYIPITVLEEIDKFKKGHEQVHFNAREFIRFLDEFSGDKIVNTGEKLGQGLGIIKILVGYEVDQAVEKSFIEHKPDHRILSAALYLQNKHPKKQTILVSKDVNLRLKAKALGLRSEDYYTDKIKDISKLYRGIRRFENIPGDIIDQLYKNRQVSAQDTPIEDINPNEYFILRGENKSGLAYYNPESEMLERVEKTPAYGIMPRNSEQVFSLHALTNTHIPLVTLCGKAGTGKTLLALAAALERRRVYKQIYLARPIVALSNKDIGFLPGDIESKIDPYMQPLFDNLGVIRSQYRESDSAYRHIIEMQESKKLLITPLAFIRGRTFNNVYFIVDEAQNLTPHEVKTIITRAGEGTKIVLTGDINQIDTPYLDSRSTGLTYLINKMQNQPLHAHVTLEKGERSELAELASNLL